MRYRVALIALFICVTALPLPRVAWAGGTTTITASGTIFAVGNTGTVYQVAQSFLVNEGNLSQLTLTLGATTGAPSGTATWEIRSDSGGNPGTILQSGAWTPTASAVNTIAVANGIYLSASTTYWLVMRSTNAQSAGNYWTWQVSATSTYANGNAATSPDGSTWTGYATYDLDCSITTVDPPTATYTATATSTGTVTATYTTTPATATYTPTPTLDFYFVSTVSSGQPVRIEYTLSAGDSLIAALLIIQITIMVFSTFIAMLRRK